MATFFVFSDRGGFEANSVDPIYSYFEKMGFYKGEGNGSFLLLQK